MNYYSARQRQSDSRWDYTYKNNALVTPVGYCAGWIDYGKEDGPKVFGSDFENYVKHKSKFHSNGHETEAEACACYRQYLLDFTMHVHQPPDKTETLHKCAMCDRFTAGAIEVNRHFLKYLCDEHRTREIAEQLFPTVAESWSSY